MSRDYSSITELPGSRATREQQARLYHRYHTAQGHAAGRRVLEVACGAGLGLGYLSHSAQSVVGGDFDESLLKTASSHYRGSIPLLRLDAHHLPFHDEAFDLLVMFEAIYYLHDPELFASECRRVLSRDGTVIIGTVNRDWTEFTPSLLSTRYLSVPELKELLIASGFADIAFYGAFPTTPASVQQGVVSLLRRVAATLHLVPKTLRGRELLKRIFYGRLEPLGPEVHDSMAPLYPLVSIDHNVANTQFKIVYAVATVS